MTLDDPEMALGALDAIQKLLDDGRIPRGTFADEQVQNLVALYNQRGDEIERLHAVVTAAADLMNRFNDTRTKATVSEDANLFAEWDTLDDALNKLPPRSEADV